MHLLTTREYHGRLERIIDSKAACAYVRSAVRIHSIQKKRLLPHCRAAAYARWRSSFLVLYFLSLHGPRRLCRGCAKASAIWQWCNKPSGARGTCAPLCCDWWAYSAREQPIRSARGHETQRGWQRKAPLLKGLQSVHVPFFWCTLMNLRCVK